MRRALTLALLRLLVLVALAASSALYYDYTRELPAFCQSGGGCEAVRQSQYAYVWGLPQPVVGLLCFAFLLAVSFLGFEHRKRWLPVVATIGAVSGLAFLGIQAFQLKAFCQLCVITDSSAIFAGALSWLHATSKEGTDGRLSRSGWTVIAVLAIAVPYVFAFNQPPPKVPADITKLWASGKLNIVELSDFECPFCRQLHFELKDALAPYQSRVHLARLTVPLPMHQNARPASRAYLCAKDRGKGEEMAHELFANEPLSPETFQAAAEKLGLDIAWFNKCVAEPATDERVTAEFEKAKQIGFKGLPTLWIGEQQLVGLRPIEELKDALDAEASGKSRLGLSQQMMWALLVALFLGGVVFDVTGKR